MVVDARAVDEKSQVAWRRVISSTVVASMTVLIMVSRSAQRVTTSITFVPGKTHVEFDLRSKETCKRCMTLGTECREVSAGVLPSSLDSMSHTAVQKLFMTSSSVVDCYKLYLPVKKFLSFCFNVRASLLCCLFFSSICFVNALAISSCRLGGAMRYSFPASSDLRTLEKITSLTS